MSPAANSAGGTGIHSPAKLRVGVPIVKVADFVELPAELLHVRAKVCWPTIDDEIASEPLAAFDPLHPSEAVHAVAIGADQFSLAAWSSVTFGRSKLIDTSGAAVGCGVVPVEQTVPGGIKICRVIAFD